MKVKWSYGVTTVPARFKDLLPRTLDSLAKAGFEAPRLFVDGCLSLPESLKSYKATLHDTNVRTFGNWVLAAWELYVRVPDADRYAIFQDDLVAYPNLRQYLENCDYPPLGYWNLYLWPQNEQRLSGWYLSGQNGLGAVGLVFSNEALRTLLCQRYMVDRPMDSGRGHRAIDGGIVDAFKKAGYKEWVHNPSLIQHTGEHSVMGNTRHMLARTFRGEDFDAMSLLQEGNGHSSDIIIPPSCENVGLVGYSCATGLGELNRQIATYCKPTGWLVKPHKNLSYDPPVLDSAILCPQDSPGRIERFIQSMGVILFCETPYFLNLPEIATRLRRRMVCVPMFEWVPQILDSSWTRFVDLFICPTLQCYNTFKDHLPCVHFPWPIDTERFKFQQRTQCKRFLFIAGHGGFCGRKGASVVMAAKAMWPEMPIVVRSQINVNWGPGVAVLPSVESNADLYNEGDVLICPHSVDGLGLEPMEAMACGMPVIVTEGDPWDEMPVVMGRIKSSMMYKKVGRKVPWYTPKPHYLVDICKGLLGSDITHHSQQARQWAESRAWTPATVDRFMELVRIGRPTK